MKERIKQLIEDYRGRTKTANQMIVGGAVDDSMKKRLKVKKNEWSNFIDDLTKLLK